MVRANGTPSVSSLDAERRRQRPHDESDMLRRVLAIHGEIVQAGLDPHRIVDVVTSRAQELTHAAGAVVEILDGTDLIYWSASGTCQSELGMRVDYSSPQAGESRRKLFGGLCDTSTLVCTAHFPSPSSGRITRWGDGFRFQGV